MLVDNRTHSGTCRLRRPAEPSRCHPQNLKSGYDRWADAVGDSGAYLDDGNCWNKSSVLSAVGVVLYKIHCQLKMLSGIASCASLLVSDACRTVSNAFEKSNEKKWTKSLSASVERTVCNIATIAAVVEPGGLTANWWLKSSDWHGWSSVGYIHSRTTNFFSNRDSTGVIEIGRKSLGSAGAMILDCSLPLMRQYNYYLNQKNLLSHVQNNNDSNRFKFVKVIQG